jgi:hypothetical protein
MLLSFRDNLSVVKYTVKSILYLSVFFCQIECKICITSKVCASYIYDISATLGLLHNFVILSLQVDSLFSGTIRQLLGSCECGCEKKIWWP